MGLLKSSFSTGRFESLACSYQKSQNSLKEYVLPGDICFRHDAVSSFCSPLTNKERSAAERGLSDSFHWS